MDQTNEQSAVPPAPRPYTKPKLAQWGSLRELTQGGGGTKKEPVGGNRTRF